MVAVNAVEATVFPVNVVPLWLAPHELTAAEQLA